MKLKNLINVLIIFIIALSSVSCEQFFTDDNSDPNKPSDVPISAALPGIELTIVDSYGGLWSQFGNMWVQQVEGVERQWESFNRYDVQPVRFNQSWTQMYENVFVELKEVSRKAEEGGFNHYLGIAKTLEAYALMMTSDVFGDMPYTEAGLGSTNDSPVYDDHATVIMPAILTLCNDALGLFNASSGGLSPGSDDVLYGGDIDNWKLAVHGILARYHLRLGNNASALAEAKLSISSSSENMAFTYPGAGNDAPWYGFNDVRQGDLEFNPVMGGIMTALNDTDRLAVMNPVFDTQHPYLTENQRVDLISYREMQFIIAECANRNGDAGAAYDALVNGVRAAYVRAGSDNDAADAYLGSLDAAGLDFERIMTEKYIAMFLQPEAYSDFRRTNIPALVPVSGTAVPVRWDYSSDEYLFNSNSPEEGAVSIYTDRVGWNR